MWSGLPLKVGHSAKSNSSLPRAFTSPGLSPAIVAVAFSAGGDGGRRPPEHQAQSVHVVCGSQRLPNNRDLWVRALIDVGANFDEFSACSDAEAVCGGVVAVSVVVAPLGILLIIHMANDQHCDQNDGCADDYSCYQLFHFPLIFTRPLRNLGRHRADRSADGDGENVLAVFSWWTEFRAQQQICCDADDDESHDNHRHPIGHFPLRLSFPRTGQ
jgi:hypothetical protein